jgi:3-isopropylmalate/(R)-2-methylmalate dehydratase small subunit
MLKGKAFRFGDNVDTDVIIPARYLTSFDPELLKAHCMEGLDPAFAAAVRPGDVIVAGANFGCGSSREHAPAAIKAAGVSCVIAKSFARIFARNSINIGLPILESAQASQAIEPGDELEIDLAAGRIKDLARNAEYQAQPLPDFMQAIIADGGLIEHTKKRLAAGLVGAAAPAAVAGPGDGQAKPRGTRMRELEAAVKSEPGREVPWEAEAKPEPAGASSAEDDDDEEEDEENQA